MKGNGVREQWSSLARRLIVFGLGLCAPLLGVAGTGGDAAGGDSARLLARAQERLAGLSVPWVGNAGQWDARAAWRAQTFAGASWVTKDGLLVHEFAGPRAGDCAGEEAADALPHRRAEACPRGAGWVLTERFVGGRIGPIEGQRPQGSRVSYFTAGREASELPTFEALDLGEVYPGVQVELKARAGNVEKLYTVAPYREAGVIRMRLEGARSVRIGQDGALEAETDHGPIRFTAPVAFQHDARGERREVEVRYALLTRTAKAVDYGFALGDYDRSRPLTIDPLLQSTYLGGGSFDPAFALAIHPWGGEVYIAGRTLSFSFPGTQNGAQPNAGGFWDAYVARFNATLTELRQSTYLGGSGSEYANALAIHPWSGDVYVAGETGSSNFPGTLGAGQSAYGGGAADAFVAHLDASLMVLHRSTYMGGSGVERAHALAIHPERGDLYVAGSTTGPFPGTSGGAQTAYGGGDDAFVARLNASLTAPHQATYLGGSGLDMARALAIHPHTGEIYVAGATQSVNFPGTAGGAQTYLGGGSDGFVARFNASLTVQHQSTYLGGLGEDPVSALAIHPATGEVYVTGRTGSNPFPGTAGGAQQNHGGGVWDTFVTRFSASLKELRQSTYLGGSASEYGNALAIHPVSGDVYVAGETNSNSFPSTLGGAQPVYGGGDNDVFIVRLDAALKTRYQATYLGGNEVERPFALAVHPQNGAVYLAGETTIAGEGGVVNFPGTAGGAQPNPVGDGDAFVSRLSLDLMSADVVPDPFVLPAQFGVPVAGLRTAGPVQVTGISVPAPITLDGALGSAVCVSSVAGCTCDVSSGWVGPTTSINNNQYLCVRHVSAPSVHTFSETRLAVGGYATKFVTFTGSLAACSLDMDGDGDVTASKEMLVMTRARLGFTPAQAVVGTGITQAQWEAKRAALAACGIVF